MSTATATKTLKTANEFYAWTHQPEHINRRFELVRGEVIELPLAKKPHGVIGGNVFGFLWLYARRTGIGYVTMAETGILLERDPDTVRGADVALFDDAHTIEDLDPDYGDVPPRLAVEVTTPDTKWAKLEIKIADYLRNRVKMVWVVNPEARTVRIHLPGQEPVTLSADEEIDGGTVLPGFRCNVIDFFTLPPQPSPESKD